MRIAEIEQRLVRLEQAFLQSQLNIVSTVEKADEVPIIKPYNVSKFAYVGDTRCEFDKKKDGMISVSINNNPCNFEVLGNKVIAIFEELEEVATITMQIQ